jgi:hypothetical protein
LRTDKNSNFKFTIKFLMTLDRSYIGYLGFVGIDLFKSVLMYSNGAICLIKLLFDLGLFTVHCLVHRTLSLDNAHTMRGTLPRVCVMHAVPLTVPRSMGMGMGNTLDTALTSGLGLLFLFLVQMLQNHRDGCNIIQIGNQGVTKGCHLSWLTNSALVYEPKCGGREELRGLSQCVQLYTGPKINFGDLTIFNL